MQLGSPLPAQPETAEEVQPGEGPLDDPAQAPKPRAVLGLAAGDHRLDAPRPQCAAVGVVVVGAVGDERVGAQPRPPDLALDRPDRVDQRQQLGDVVAVAAGQGGGERDAAGVGQKVVL